MATKKAVSPADEYRLERMTLDEVARWPRNPKKHDEPGIEASIKRFGFVQPITLDEKTKQLVVGHGRLEVLERMFAAGDEPPKNIRVVKGKWHVPVIRGVSFKNDDEAEAYLVADNHLSEAGGWNEEGLKTILRSIQKGIGDDVVVTGYSKTELDAMLAPPAGAGVAPTSTHAPSLSLQFTTEETRDEVKKAIGAAARDKDLSGDVLARLLGVGGKAKRAKR